MRIKGNKTLKGTSLYVNLMKFDTTGQLDKMKDYLNTFKPNSKTLP